jgi:hypothetical protein
MTQIMISRPKKREKVTTATVARTLPTWSDRRAIEQALRAADARRRISRRRFVNPTVCERDYAAAELDLTNAMEEYKRTRGRMFPTWCEVLEVLVALGYEKPVIYPTP